MLDVQQRLTGENEKAAMLAVSYLSIAVVSAVFLTVSHRGRPWSAFSMPAMPLKLIRRGPSGAAAFLKKNSPGLLTNSAKNNIIHQIIEKAFAAPRPEADGEKNMELLNGRPENAEGRLPREMRTYDLLDSLGIEYQRTDHERTDTMEACLEVDGILGVVICKNLFLCNRQKTSFYLLMMPGDKKFRTKELSAQIGSSRLSFADPDDMLKYLDIEPGAVSIMGLMNDKEGAVQLLIDEDVLKDGYIGCHPCVNTSSLRMRTEDVTEKFLPAVGHGYRTVRLLGED